MTIVPGVRARCKCRGRAFSCRVENFADKLIGVVVAVLRRCGAALNLKTAVRWALGGVRVCVCACATRRV